MGLLINISGYFLYLALAYQGLEPKLAMTIVYFIGVVAGFFGHGKFTFNFSGNDIYAVGKYLIAHCGGYGLAFVILAIFYDSLGFPHQMVQAFAIIVVSYFLFISFKFFVFNAKKIP